MNCPRCGGFVTDGQDQYGAYHRCLHCGWRRDIDDAGAQLYPNIEALERKRALRQRPEAQERTREYMRDYRRRPEVRERQREHERRYMQNPEVRERRREYDRLRMRRTRAQSRS